MKELAAHQLYRSCDPARLGFQTTREIEPFAGLLGQPRAVAAVELGIGIANHGYNVFAFGSPGTGKHKALEGFLEEAALKRPVPNDLCYVNNFDDAQKPRLLRLPGGRARGFQKDMQELVEELGSVLGGAFESDQYQTRRQVIEESFEERQSKALSELAEQARAQGIALLRTPLGIVFAPVRGDDVLAPEEFQKLPEDERTRLKKQIEQFQAELQKILHQLPAWQREKRNLIQQLNLDVSTTTVGPQLDEVRARYADVADVIAYLAVVEKDILQNAQAFVSPAGGQQQDALQLLAGGRGVEKPFLRRYGVNVLVDHSETKGAPVVYETNPTYQNLVGRVEHISHMGALVTDFNLIRAGALHRANGGYLLLDALRLLTQPFAWAGLKRALEAQQLKIESLGEALSLVSTYSLEPEPMPTSVKIVLVGEPIIYYLLQAYDPDFPRLFKVAADFAEQMPRTPESERDHARVIARLLELEKLRPFDAHAVARVIEHGARDVGDAERLSLSFSRTLDLLREADHWAGSKQREVVGVEDVEQAIEAKIYRSDRLRERLLEETLRGTLLIDTTGGRAGRVNGLSVLQLGDFAFGRPSRITAGVRLGKGEVINIEREVELSGPIHSKGVLILSGFLGSRFAREQPLALQASLVFEQSYGGIEGDSASSAELYALLSALADVPIRQGVAVTGSVNQQGEIQAIGGVNEKIEGFFALCQARGLDGEQGVVIPVSNVKDLMLHREVVAAVAAGRFHVWAVTTVDEGIELLTGVPAGVRGEEGRFPEGSVNFLVEQQLAAFAHKAREFSAPEKKEPEKTAAGEGKEKP